MPKFLIADDHPLYREALILALQPLFVDVEIVQSDCLDSTLAALQQAEFDLILLDLNMPGCESFYGLTRVTSDFPEIPVAVVSASDSIEIISNAMSMGANGFIPKSTPTQVIAEALQQILDGNHWLPDDFKSKVDHDISVISIAKLVGELTPKQFKVLKLLETGLLNKQIAAELSISEATVKAHISAILRKLNVNTRTQAVLLLKSIGYS